MALLSRVGPTIACDEVTSLMGSTAPPFPGDSTPPPATGPDAVDRQHADSALARLPRLASGLLHAPVAFVVRVEGGLPRLACSVGLPDDCGRELPASHPFWGRVLGAGETATFEDAL